MRRRRGSIERLGRVDGGDAEHHGDDARRLAVRLGGMLGTVTTRTMSATEAEAKQADADAAFDEFDELYEMGSPVDSNASSSPTSFTE